MLRQTLKPDCSSLKGKQGKKRKAEKGTQTESGARKKAAGKKDQKKKRKKK